MLHCCSHPYYLQPHCSLNQKKIPDCIETNTVKVNFITFTFTVKYILWLGAGIFLKREMNLMCEVKTGSILRSESKLQSLIDEMKLATYTCTLWNTEFLHFNQASEEQQKSYYRYLLSILLQYRCHQYRKALCWFYMVAIVGNRQVFNVWKLRRNKRWCVFNLQAYLRLARLNLTLTDISLNRLLSTIGENRDIGWGGHIKQVQLEGACSSDESSVWG